MKKQKFTLMIYVLQVVKKMNKSLITNLISSIICLISFFSPIYKETLFSVGFFALSGGLTNWIAIHMIFEKVPFLYGSGVIVNNFEEFKYGIKNLILNEFFNRENIKQFLDEENSGKYDEIIKKIDFEKIFSELLSTISLTKIGGMLSMFGGVSALQPLKEPIINKLKDLIKEFLEDTKQNKNESLNLIIYKLEYLVDLRLNDLTPQEIKEIMQKIIKRHLGWLVVWGGIFGGLIGFIASIISKNMN